MEIQFKIPNKPKHVKHVVVVIDLEIGEIVRITGLSRKLDGKDLKITEIKNELTNSESGVMVKVDKYDHWIDSNWIEKKVPDLFG